ncbi:MAG: nucleoside recognition domain-containing protein [Bacillota bacterium]|nr:nucleoside recognition domain-containing protein [Bacillota bacterium]
MLTRIWVFMIAAAAVIGFLSGRQAEITAAVTNGASGAVSLILSITGVMCLWSGVMRVLSESGLASKIAAAMRPVLRLLFKELSEDREVLELISANITANLLGLGNAATPIGLKAAQKIHERSGGKGPTDDLITFIVINTASLQLIPTTVAAVRASLGAARPYDILPAVWLSSAASVSAALSAAFVLRSLSRSGKESQRINGRRD